MESELDYFARKKEEIKWLQKRMKIENPSDISLNDAHAVFKLKLGLRAKRISQFYATNIELVESNFLHSGKPWEIGDFEVDFDYQRFDLSVKGPYPYAYLNNLAYNSNVAAFYLNSGIACISIIKNTIRRINTLRWHLIGLEDSYFESQQIFNNDLDHLSTTWIKNYERIEEAIEKTNKDKLIMLLIDSISQFDFFDRQNPLNDSRLDLIIFDSTCELNDSDACNRTINYAEEIGIPLILLRSHTKLDYLGIEYSRLGSVVIFTPQKSSKQHTKLAAIIAQLVKDEAKSNGSFCIPHALSFSLDIVGNRLNAQRVNRIKENHVTLANELSSFKDYIRTYKHGLFITMHDLNNSDVNDSKAIDKFIKKCKDKNLAVVQNTSFGLDLNCLALYTVPTASGNVLRISLSDHHTQSVKEIAKLFLSEGLFEALQTNET